MWNTGSAETVLQLKTLSMICRMFSDVWKPSERIQTVLNCPGENVTITEIPSAYNSQHTLKLCGRSLNQGWCYWCFVSMTVDLLLVYFEAGVAEECVEKTHGKFHFIMGTCLLWWYGTDEMMMQKSRVTQLSSSHQVLCSQFTLKSGCAQKVQNLTE